MHDPFILPIGALLDIMPYAILCYMPFMNKLRVSKKKLTVILSSIAIIQFIVYFMNNYIPYWLVKSSFLAWLVIYFLVYIKTININFSKLLFIFLLQINYAGSIIGVSNSLILHFWPNAVLISGYNVPLIHIRLCIFVITLPFALFLNKKISLLLMFENSKAWSTLWIIPFSYVISLIVCVDKDNLVESWQYVMVTITMAICAYATYFVVIKMFFEVHENAKLKEKVRMVNLLLAFQEETYKSLSERIAETRAARHDIKHHLAVIDAYLQSDNKEALSEYLYQYKSSLPDDSEFVFCENYAANVIVHHCVENAKKENIAVCVNMQIPPKIGIPDSDLCIVLGNCLENALEACKRMQSEQRYINLRSELRRNMLGITIDNSFDGLVEEKDGMFFSHKRDHQEGVGLSSVRAVAAKHHGLAQFAFDGKEFQASIILSLREQG